MSKATVPVSDHSEDVGADETLEINGAARFFDDNPLVMEAYDRTLVQESLRTNALVPVASSRDGAEAIIRLLQSGCEFESLLTALRDEIGAFVGVLAKNEHGSSVVLKIFKIGTAIQRARLWLSLRGRFLDLIAHPVGHRVVIQAMLRAHDGCEDDVLTEIKHKLNEVACDKFGSKVLLAVINPNREGRHEAAIDTICDQLRQEVKDVASSRHGSLVITALVRSCGRSHKLLVPALIDAAGELLFTEPGAAVLEAVVEFRSKEVSDELVDAHVKDALLATSCSKSGSRVVNACLTHGSDKARRLIAEQALERDADGEDLIVVRMFHNYVGSHVVQTILQLAPDEYRSRLLEVLKSAADVNNMKHAHTALTETSAQASPEFEGSDNVGSFYQGIFAGVRSNEDLRALLETKNEEMLLLQAQVAEMRAGMRVSRGFFLPSHSISAMQPRQL